MPSGAPGKLLIGTGLTSPCRANDLQDSSEGTASLGDTIIREIILHPDTSATTWFKMNQPGGELLTRGNMTPAGNCYQALEPKWLGGRQPAKSVRWKEDLYPSTDNLFPLKHAFYVFCRVV